MAYSNTKYVADGSTNIFSIPFPYLEKAHIHAYVNGIEVSFTWATDATISLDVVPAAGAVVGIQRETPLDHKLVDFQNTSILVEQNLDKNTDQLLFVNQEQIDKTGELLTVDVDNKYDAKGRGIKNLADPVNPTDAMNYKSAKASVDSAKVSADAAKVSETKAKASENAAQSSENAAKDSEEAARLSEAHALSSEQNAKTYEQSAATHAEAASISETNAAASEADAAESAANALASEQAARVSEDAAKASELAAATSEANAAASASTASQKAQAAANSEANAAQSASAASTSAAQAAQSAIDAQTAKEDVLSGSYSKIEVDTMLSGKSDTDHLHDSRYFTETEINTKLATKSDTTHNHDDKYYTEAEVDIKLNNVETANRTLDQTQIPAGNIGSLRQLLDWFANRIKAILGTTNWYDAPPTTLQEAKDHIGSGGSAHALATTSAAGFMSGADKSKLDSLVVAVDKNVIDITGGLFVWDSGFATGRNIYFEVVGSVGYAAGTAYFELKTSSGTIVVTLSTSATSAVRLRSSSIALSNGTTYRVSTRTTGNEAAVAHLSAARIIVL